MSNFRERFAQLDQDRQVLLIFAAALGGCLVATVIAHVPGIIGELAGVVVLAAGFLTIISGAMSLGILVRRLSGPSGLAAASTSATNTPAVDTKVHHQKSLQWQRISSIARRVAKFSLLSIAVPLILGLVMPVGHTIWQLLFELSITVGLCAVVMMLVSASAITYHASRAGYKAGRQGFVSPSNPVAPTQAQPSELARASDPRPQQPIGPPPSRDRGSLPNTDPAAGVTTPTSSATSRSRRRKWAYVAAALVAIALIATLSSKHMDRTSSAPVPPASSGEPVTNFNGWRMFGGIDSSVENGGSLLSLDTHDTTQTWRTKWSGAIGQTQAVCAIKINAKVRDVSHATGSPGGFGIGLGSLQEAVGDATLSGSAVQFDFGQDGYRTASYPDDTDFGLVPANLDHAWHDVTLQITSDGRHEMEVDGREVVNTVGASQCGQPFIRVWAGAAQISQLQIGVP